MRTVNMLPGWYRQQQRRHKNIRVHLALMLLLGGGMIGLSFLGRRQRDVLEEQRGDLANVLKASHDPEPELRQLKSQLQDLQELQLARHELGNTIPMSAVIQQLQNAMSSGMAFSNVTIDVHSEPIRGSGFVGDAKNPPRYHEVAQIVVQGIAPNNDKIAAFIQTVSANQLFADVTLDYTRNAELLRYPVRRFQIQLSMDLENLAAEMPNSLASGVPGNGL